MDKVSLAIPVYGPQYANWWHHLALLIAHMSKTDIELVGMHTANSMMTDSNRNEICAEFLKTKGEWLFWLDADNSMPAWGIRRLLDTQKDLVSGMYYLKQNRAAPVAYMRTETMRYANVEEFNRGELLPIDTAGMGAVLMHRSVLEKIRDSYVPLQTWEGGLIAVHKDDIKGEIPDKPHSYPKVFGGALHLPLCKPTWEIKAFPWFMLQYGRTEDLIFFEMAKRCGIQLWLDTGVSVGHLGLKEWDWDDFMTYKMLQENRQPTNLDIEVTNVHP